MIPLLALLLVGPVTAHGQRSEPPLPSPGWVGEATALGVNALLGGVTAGVMQKARGGSFQDGFTRGVLGGAVIYGGKRVAVEDFAGAGLVGRELAALGASVVRNASEARPSLERLALPLGPVRVYLLRDEPRPLRVKLDLATAIVTAYALTVPELEWDAASTLSTGAPVFRVRDLLIRGRGTDNLGASGRTRVGTVFLSQLAGIDYQEDLRHELIHVIQNDHFFWTWTSPAENWLLERVPGGSLVGRYVDLNLSPLVTSTLAEAFKRYEHRPWELEAEYLARR